MAQHPTHQTHQTHPTQRDQVFLGLLSQLILNKYTLTTLNQAENQATLIQTKGSIIITPLPSQDALSIQIKRDKGYPPNTIIVSTLVDVPNLLSKIMYMVQPSGVTNLGILVRLLLQVSAKTQLDLKTEVVKGSTKGVDIKITSTNPTTLKRGVRKFTLSNPNVQTPQFAEITVGDNILTFRTLEDVVTHILTTQPREPNKLT